jgi:hypothetical protein
MRDDYKEWLENEFATKWMGRTLRGDALNAYYKAEMILKGRHAIQKRSCGCQYGSMARAVDKMYEDYLTDNK